MLYVFLTGATLLDALSAIGMEDIGTEEGEGEEAGKEGEVEARRSFAYSLDGAFYLIFLFVLFGVGT